MKIDSINQKEVLRYLGNSDIVPDEKLSLLLKNCEEIFLKNAKPCYTYKIFSIESASPKGIILHNCKLSLNGSSIFSHLEGCSRVILLGATLSHHIDRLIRLSQISDVSRAVIFDAMANVAIEQVCDMAEKEIKADLLNHQIPPFAKTYFAKRFSPGYGDLPLSMQTQFLQVLEAQKRIGLCATENNLLTPKKSVTAIIGVSETPIKQSCIHGCQSCNLYNTCIYRKRGEHCENK